MTFCAHTVAQTKVDELSQQLQEMNMKFDELQNKMKSKDEKIATLEKSISTVKERCAAKLKVRIDCYLYYCKNHNSKLSTRPITVLQCI